MLKAGGAYVPLDPAYPAARIAFILEDAQAAVLLTTEVLRHDMAATSSTVVCLDTDGPRIAARSVEAPAIGVTAQDLAYVIYTSGSTGKPKGVAIEHRNAVALVEWASGVFSADELAGVLASTSVCFDLSVFEMFVPLARGGTVIVVADVFELPELGPEAAVTLINTVPSAMAELLRLGRGIPQTVRELTLSHGARP